MNVRRCMLGIMLVLSAAAISPNGPYRIESTAISVILTLVLLMSGVALIKTSGARANPK
ncbi:MAG: hypothetical protein ACI8QF_000218 [Limisphaerales bacterium]|jgi:hypothetical protein